MFSWGVIWKWPDLIYIFYRSHCLSLAGQLHKAVLVQYGSKLDYGGDSELDWFTVYSEDKIFNI